MPAPRGWEGDASKEQLGHPGQAARVGSLPRSGGFGTRCNEVRLPGGTRDHRHSNSCSRSRQPGKGEPVPLRSHSLERGLQRGAIAWIPFVTTQKEDNNFLPPTNDTTQFWAGSF